LFANQTKHTYTISLQPSTAKEVIEWFEIADANHRLADAIIELVYASIKSAEPLNMPMLICDERGKLQENQNSLPINQDEFFENLYNWQTSNSAIFKEDKKEKRKMLTI